MFITARILSLLWPLCILPLNVKLQICKETYDQFYESNVQILIKRVETYKNSCEKKNVRLTEIIYVQKRKIDVFKCEFTKLIPNEANPTTNNPLLPIEDFFIAEGRNYSVFLLKESQKQSTGVIKTTSRVKNSSGEISPRHSANLNGSNKLESENGINFNKELGSCDRATLESEYKLSPDNPFDLSRSTSESENYSDFDELPKLSSSTSEIERNSFTNKANIQHTTASKSMKKIGKFLSFRKPESEFETVLELFGFIDQIKTLEKNLILGFLPVGWVKLQPKVAKNKHNIFSFS